MNLVKGAEAGKGRASLRNSKERLKQSERGKIVMWGGTEPTGSLTAILRTLAFTVSEMG